MREYYTEAYYASHLNSKINDQIDVDQLYGNSCATLPPHGDLTTLPPYGDPADTNQSVTTKSLELSKTEDINKKQE